MTDQLVWFKRDLRWHDHAALHHAARHGRVRCIYLIEPGLWRQPDTALQHFEFMRESLLELDTALQARGLRLEVHDGACVDVLDAIWRQAPFTALHSHQETGNGWTYQRDLQVAAWCQTRGVRWHEYPQFGVVRPLRSRDLWQMSWERHMAAPQLQLDTVKGSDAMSPVASLVSRPAQIRAPAHLQHNPPRRQRGGRAQALATLRSFLDARSLGYRGGISSPLSAPDACSRLSPYLAWGCLSLREVVQQTRAHLAALPPTAERHRAGLTAFISRLYWHCHFIQKLDSEPEIEWRNMHRGYDGLREHAFNPAYFEALQHARTGWPMVDASVIMLRETGWLNFRMRAMLVSVAAYPLWLHWRPVGEWLATQFLDYEPGIHWSQMQMQAGTTGINTTRVYNPIKQAQDHDPHGRFVRQWLPAMRRVPPTWLFEPWLMPPSVQSQCGVRIGHDLPSPVVDWNEAARAAKQRVHARRQTDAVREGNAAVVERHASRKPRAGAPRGGSRPAAPGSRRSAPSANIDTPQLGFDF